MSEKNSGNVVVACRVRPINNKEKAMGTSCCIDFSQDHRNLTLNMSTESSSAFGQNKFCFDRVFDMDSQQKEVYDYAARPIIDSVIDGFNGTIFAYG